LPLAKGFSMRTKSIFLGLLGALVLVLPVSAQRGGPDDLDPDTRAELARLNADPALSLQANADFLANNRKQQGVLTRPSGLQYKIIQNGFGRHPNGGDSVEVYYTGKLINGKVFDGTSPGLPATFTVKSGQIISGWVEALQLMRVGDHWQIWIPATAGYGVKGNPRGSIPPNQTLIFDLRLLAATPAPRKGEPGYRPEPGEEDAPK
jgi:FKBP-type peptidyl-prolyl cis-trans isomerase